MSRTQEWPVLWMCGMQMCIAALGCAAFIGCGSAPSNQVTANQFRPAQEEQKKKTDKEEGEKKADPAVSNEKNQTVAAPPKAPKHLDAAENGSETAPPNAPAGKEPTGPYAAKLKAEIDKM